MLANLPYCFLFPTPAFKKTNLNSIIFREKNICHNGNLENWIHFTVRKVCLHDQLLRGTNFPAEEKRSFFSKKWLKEIFSYWFVFKTWFLNLSNFLGATYRVSYLRRPIGNMITEKLILSLLKFHKISNWTCQNSDSLIGS